MFAVAACFCCNSNWDEQARNIFLSFWNSLIGSTEKIKITQEDRDSCFEGVFQMWEQREVERGNVGEEKEKKDREFVLVEPGSLRERSRVLREDSTVTSSSD